MMDAKNLIMPLESLKAFTVHEGQCVATVTCHCRLGNMPMLLVGTQIEGICKFCGAGFKILAVDYDLRKGDRFPTVSVGRRDGAGPPSSKPV